MKSGLLIVTFVLGIFTGAGVTYLYMDKKKDEAVDEAVREIRAELEKPKEDVKENNNEDPLVSATKRFDDLMEIKKEHERQLQENGSVFVDYSKVVDDINKMNVDISQEALDENAEKNERIAEAEEMANETMKPFTTDLETYSDAFLNHSKEQATYYIRDDTLIDEAGDIADTDYLIGRWNLDNFINGPYDEGTNDTLYIINPSAGVDLEIQIIDDVSYDPASDGD